MYVLHIDRDTDTDRAQMQMQKGCPDRTINYRSVFGFGFVFWSRFFGQFRTVSDSRSVSVYISSGSNKNAKYLYKIHKLSRNTHAHTY